MKTLSTIPPIYFAFMSLPFFHVSVAMKTISQGNFISQLFIILLTQLPTACMSFPVGRKISLKECVFVNSALKIHCHVVKNTLLYWFFGDFGQWV